MIQILNTEKSFFKSFNSFNDCDAICSRQIALQQFKESNE